MHMEGRTVSVPVPVPPPIVVSHHPLCCGLQAMEVDLLHEIPVRVMRAADIQYYTPPDVPPPRVQLELPYNRVRF